MKFPRASGILLHPTSLPGPEGLGTLGPEAFAFVRFLAQAGQHLWQMLPIGPPGYGDSPYACFSSVAGSPMLISVEGLARDGWLRRADLAGGRSRRATRVDFAAAEARKVPLLIAAHDAFRRRARPAQREEFARFCAEEAWWLDDFAEFMALKQAHGNRPWWRWPDGERFRRREAMARARDRLSVEVSRQQFLQFMFFTQWGRVKDHAHANGVRIVGDVPIYVAHDSADVWAYPDVFLLDRRRQPRRVAGVPPDFFSRTGQLWGNPVYNWPHLERTGFGWWERRIRASLSLYDIVRMDHFRGLCAYWGVPFGKRTAMHGRWYRAPGRALLTHLKRAIGDIPMIGEDLGMITPDVRALRDEFGLPGMKILHYAFGGGADNEFLPHNYGRHFVVYTGTHDNATTASWFRTSPAHVRKHARAYLGDEVDRSVWPFIRLAWQSMADTAIVPMQDLLELGDDGRMNVPGTTINNWQWRMRPGAASRPLAARLLALTRACGR